MDRRATQVGLAGLSLACTLVLGPLMGGCARTPTPSPLDRIALEYVDLANALMRLDPQAASGDTASEGLTGPNSTLAEANDIAEGAADAQRRLDALPAGGISGARRRWLRAQLRGVAARARQQLDGPLSLQDELLQFYGVSGPSEPERGLLDDTRQAIDRLLPGSGDAAARLEAFEADLMVPAPRLPAVFERALAECRARTAARMSLPPGESVTVKYVVGEPWSGFSTYHGHGRSVVSVNTSYPLTVDRVLQLACHEGYPGHHVINVLRDTEAAARPELAAVPLFTPDAYETEAIATHAATLVFDDDARVAFERDVLFPLAGLDPSRAERHVTVARLVERLAPAIGAALARYLSGDGGFVEASWQLQQDALMQHPRATLEFARLYRGFALAYTGAASPPGGIASEWLGTAGFPVGPVIISGNGHHSPTSSHGR
ncbi:MAG: hypothetical protein U0Q55_14020 [Vicinamibacterales bacterium]